MSLKKIMDRMLKTKSIKKSSNFGGFFSAPPLSKRVDDNQQNNNSFSAPPLSKRVDDNDQNSNYMNSPYISRTVDENEQQYPDGNYISKKTTWGSSKSGLMKKMAKIIKEDGIKKKAYSEPDYHEYGESEEDKMFQDDLSKLIESTNNSIGQKEFTLEEAVDFIDDFVNAGECHLARRRRYSAAPTNEVDMEKIKKLLSSGSETLEVPYSISYYFYNEHLDNEDSTPYFEVYDGIHISWEKQDEGTFKIKLDHF